MTDKQFVLGKSYKNELDHGDVWQIQYPGGNKVTAYFCSFCYQIHPCVRLGDKLTPAKVRKLKKGGTTVLLSCCEVSDEVKDREGQDNYLAVVVGKGKLSKREKKKVFEHMNALFRLSSKLGASIYKYGQLLELEDRMGELLTDEERTIMTRLLENTKKKREEIDTKYKAVRSMLDGLT